MKTFFKTFVICALICCAWLLVVNFERMGFEPELKLDNDIYKQSEETPKEEKKETSEIPKERLIKVYFISDSGKIISKERSRQNPSLKDAIVLLLQGPNSKEKKEGIYSEIPPRVILLSLDEKSDKIIINLSSKFVEGGGTMTIMNRIKQLVKTVNSYSDKKPIYLYVEGKQVEYIGGDGVYLEQPLNEDLLN